MAGFATQSASTVSSRLAEPGIEALDECCYMRVRPTANDRERLRLANPKLYENDAHWEVVRGASFDVDLRLAEPSLLVALQAMIDLQTMDVVRLMRLRGLGFAGRLEGELLREALPNVGFGFFWATPFRRIECLVAYGV